MKSQNKQSRARRRNKKINKRKLKICENNLFN